MAPLSSRFKLLSFALGHTDMDSRGGARMKRFSAIRICESVLPLSSRRRRTHPKYLDLVLCARDSSQTIQSHQPNDLLLHRSLVHMQSMAGIYNGAGRPEPLPVADRQARTLQRRNSVADLIYRVLPVMNPRGGP